MKRINICMNGCATKPIGGHKVLYEVANRLAEDGYEVTVNFASKDNLYQLPFSSEVRVVICKLLTDYLKLMPNWFKFDKQVHLNTIYDFSETSIPDGDVIIASSKDTAIPIYNLSDRCGKKVYFIQDFENWDCSDEEVIKTYKLGMKNIVISNWLKEVVSIYDKNNVEIVPNAIDSKIFYVKNPVEKRNQHVVGLLYHTGEHKGLKYAFAALNKVKKVYPDLIVKIFGTPRRPNDLPQWYEYHRKISQNSLCNLYNECTLFLCATIEEGFGLTGAESMACGCTLVSTSYKGVREYANNSNSLLSSPRDAQALANNMIYLFENDDVRCKLAVKGVEDIKKRSWEKSLAKLESIIDNL